MSDLPDSLNGFQTLAWIVWRTQAAVVAFSGDDAGTKWDAVCGGDFSSVANLGKPMVTPVAAEDELRRAMRTGRLPYTVESP